MESRIKEAMRTDNVGGLYWGHFWVTGCEDVYILGSYCSVEAEWLAIHRPYGKREHKGPARDPYRAISHRGAIMKGTSFMLKWNRRLP